ncbi:MAG: EamA family transporter [Rhodanobacteraceae bacterium]
MQLLAATLWSMNVVLDTFGHVAFKSAARDASADGYSPSWWRFVQTPWLWAGVGCFGLEFLVWLAFLSLVPLSQGVLLGSFNIVVLMLAGRWLFGESLTRWRVAGITLVAFGVACVGFG